MSVSGEERGRKELGEFGEPATARFRWWEAGNARLRALGILQAVGSHYNDLCFGRAELVAL